MGDGEPHAMAWTLGYDWPVDLFPNGKLIGRENPNELKVNQLHHMWGNIHATLYAFDWSSKIQWWEKIFP